MSRRGGLLQVHSAERGELLPERSVGRNRRVELQRAIERSQRQNVQVYTLFASGSGRFRRNSFLVGNGQGALSRLALETGGEAYFQGFSTPVSFEPFLKELQQTLGQQYLLTFRAAPVEKSSFQRVRITTEAPGVELMAPTRVWVPAR